MKQLITLIAILPIAMLLRSQRNGDVPAFGKVEKADLEIKECDFDKKADALVLFDVGELYCDISNGVTMQLEKHVRIKILKDKGVDQADIKIRYHSYHNDEYINNLTAQTYNLDAAGNIVTTGVEKKLIYDKAINQRYSQKVFTFPEAKAGSIIEYKYVDWMNGLSVKNWYFQKSIPVKFSRYTMDFPNELIVTATQKGVLTVDEKEEQKSYATGKRTSSTGFIRSRFAAPDT